MSPIKALAPLSGIAMVSRIRVEVRGSSMESAEEVAALFLDHARMAGYIEGITPQEGAFTDHHFHYPQMTGKPGDPLDPWSELGLRYAGRMAFTFEPASQVGGIQQHGFEVVEIEDFTPHGLYGASGSETEPVRTDVTESVFVLHRCRAVTRFNERSDLIVEPDLSEASAEEILDNIGRLKNVTGVTVSLTTGPELERIYVVRANTVSESGKSGGKVECADPSLREAALQVYGECGVEVTHYDTVKD